MRHAAMILPLLVLVLAAGAAPAPAPAETVAQLEARLADLKKQTAALEERIRQAKGAAPATDLAAILKTMPAAMAPKKGETPRQAGDREEWLKNAMVGKRVAATFGVGSAQTILPFALTGLLTSGVQVSVAFETAPEHRVYPGDTVHVEATVKAVRSVAGNGGVPMTAVDLEGGNVLAVTPQKPK